MYNILWTTVINTQIILRWSSSTVKDNLSNELMKFITINDGTIFYRIFLKRLMLKEIYKLIYLPDTSMRKQDPLEVGLYLRKTIC